MLIMKMTPYQSAMSFGRHARQAEQPGELQALHDRQEDRHGEQENADPVEEHAEDEQHDHHEQQDAVGREAGAEDRVGDEGLPALDDEEADEHRRAEEDPHDHRRRLERGERRVLDRDPVEPAMHAAHQQRAEGADAGRLDRRRDADEDDAEHQDDQAGSA